jgi:PilZ domain
MLVSDVDSNYSKARRIALKGYDVQYIALPEEILIDDYPGNSAKTLNCVQPTRQKRKYCRYVRNDIRVKITDSRLPFRREFTEARLIDVSQVGVSIRCPKRLRCGQSLRLVLSFEDGESFEFIGVTVNRRCVGLVHVYGVKFEKSSRRFEEHLLKTGLKRKLNNRTTTD